MTAPNIVGVTRILGETVGALLTTSSADVLSNAAASDSVLKVNSVYVSNVDGSNAADVTVGYRNAANAEYRLASTIEVPAGATLVVVTKDSAVYLQEDCQLFAFASANNDLELVVSYEEIS